jgi:hypothetical protein
MSVGTLARRSASEVDAAHALHVGSGPHDGPRCACRHDGTHWRAMCVAAAAAFNALHAEAMAAHLAGRAPE